jgi:hypothetical protein
MVSQLCQSYLHAADHKLMVQSVESPPAEETKSSAAASLKSFISGGFGGSAAVLVGEWVKDIQ